MLGALGTAGGLLYYHPASPFSLAVNAFVAVSLLSAGVAAWMALDRGGIPAEVGVPTNRERLRKPAYGSLSAELWVYLGAALAIVVLVMLVSGFAIFTSTHRPLSLLSEPAVQDMQKSASPLVRALAVPAEEVSRPAGLVLVLCVVVAFGYLIVETFRLPRVPHHRMFVVLILTFFSMVFFAFYEQAGSSLSNFTDRNVNRVFGARHITPDEVGKTIDIQPTQEQLGYFNGNQCFTLDVLDKLRAEHENKTDFEIEWKVTQENVGMGLAKRVQEIPTSTFQSVNPIYILIFGLVFTALWTLLANRGLEPSTPVKFSLGLLQLGLGFGVFWYGADGRPPRHGRPLVALPGLSAAHDGRALPFPRRPFDDHQALAAATDQHRDGRHGSWPPPYRNWRPESSPNLRAWPRGKVLRSPYPRKRCMFTGTCTAR